MANYNKLILLGNVTRDPQLSYLPSQTPVVEFGLAVSRRWRAANGEQRDEVCFIDCRCYGKQAETFNQYVTKGKAVLLEGRLQFDQWESPDGQKRSKHRMFVENFQFISSGQGGPGGGQRGAAPAGKPAQAAGASEPPPSDDEFSRPDQAGGEEIPF
jgi:single-strand DNA-binding protein